MWNIFPSSRPRSPSDTLLVIHRFCFLSAFSFFSCTFLKQRFPWCFHATKTAILTVRFAIAISSLCHQHLFTLPSAPFRSAVSMLLLDGEHHFRALFAYIPSGQKNILLYISRIRFSRDYAVAIRFLSFFKYANVAAECFFNVTGKGGICCHCEQSCSSF